MSHSLLWQYRDPGQYYLQPPHSYNWIKDRHTSALGKPSPENFEWGIAQNEIGVLPRFDTNFVKSIGYSCPRPKGSFYAILLICAFASCKMQWLALYHAICTTLHCQTELLQCCFVSTKTLLFWVTCQLGFSLPSDVSTWLFSVIFNLANLISSSF